jgi:GDP-L-fucose synthase
MREGSRIFVAGHGGLAGSALVRALQRLGYRNLILRSRGELDLMDQRAVLHFFETERPEYVFLAAAKVGGILANSTFPVDFLRDNLAIQSNVTEAARRCVVEKFVFLGSSCIYPRMAPQPIPESALLTGPLEPTNEWYAVAKVAGIKLVQAYRKQYGMKGICLMPTNLYGPGDNFDLASSHVLPALLRKFHEAKLNGAGEVVVWGSGKVLREFLHVDDFADAAVHLMLHYDSDEIINVGTGEDLTIAALAELIGRVVGYPGRITFDASKPDGTPRKLLDVSRLHAAGWRARITLEEGIRRTYEWYLAQSTEVVTNR